MLIAIVHYHLNRGGVTQVIANHLRGLANRAVDDGPLRVVVLHGGRSVGWPDRLPGVDSLDYTVRVVPGLDYDEGQPCGPRELAARLRVALVESGGSPESTVVHVHNHSLGKNIDLPQAVAELASDGWPLLLQIHDFAEDFRPPNYQRLRAGGSGRAEADWAATLYPQAAHVHYAVLNQRDTRILTAAGVEPTRVHALPNPVGDPGPLPPREPVRRELSRRFGVPADRPLLLYPIRGIRRKNLGEALLWSALARGVWHLGVTMPPLNPAERPSYDRWKTLAASLALPAAFEIGGEAGLAYVENLAAADRMLTTSVAEGFGLVFLEAWLAGQMLIGRDLPEITADFRAAGLQLNDLRPRFDVPLDWIDAADWRVQIEQRYGATLAQFGRTLPPPSEFHRELDGLVVDGLVDFGSLPSQHQQQVVGQVADSDERRRRLRCLNPWLEGALQQDRTCGPVVEENANVVRRGYSLEACGRRLSQLYRAVAASPRTACPRTFHAERILDEFLSLPRFQPIRVES
jgi:glycosyltransferase involved in cell wall biosynthesis